MRTPRSQSRHRLVRALTCALLVMGVCGSPAAAAVPPAGTVAASGSTVTFTDDQIATNDLQASIVTGQLELREAPGATLTDGDGAGGCAVAAEVATCPIPTRLQIELGGGADAADCSALGTSSGVTLIVANLGSGTDSYSGSARVDRITGGTGDDTMSGGAGNDRFEQGSGEDGADRMTGGAGTDTASYTGRSAAIRVDFDNNDDDGAIGENDDVRSDVENASGGSGGDTLVGNARINALRGNGGDDTLRGKAAADALTGGAGDDVIFGDAGADVITGDAGDDTLGGGDGKDRLFGRAGRDYLDVRDHRAGDRAACGSGSDTAMYNAGDRTSSCEGKRRVP